MFCEQSPKIFKRSPLRCQRSSPPNAPLEKPQCMNTAYGIAGKAVSVKTIAKSPNDAYIWKLTVRNKQQNEPKELFRLFIRK
jgi:hypothetical protein